MSQDSVALPPPLALQYRPGQPGVCQHPNCDKAGVPAKDDLWCADPDHAGCGFPGCDWTVKPREPGQLKPNSYCFQLIEDSRGIKVEHNRNTAFQERNRLGRSGRRDAGGITSDPTPGPITMAVSAAEIAVDDFAKSLTDQKKIIERTLGALTTLGNPAAASEEIERIRSQAKEEVGAAEVRAQHAERVARTAQTLMEEAQGAAQDMQVERDEAIERAETAERDADEARQHAEAADIATQQATDEAADAARLQAEAETARDAALAEATRAGEERDGATAARNTAHAEALAAREEAREAHQRAEAARVAQSDAEAARDAAIEARDTAQDAQRIADSEAARASERAEQATVERRAAEKERDTARSESEKLRTRTAELDRNLAATTATRDAAIQARDTAQTQAADLDRRLIEATGETRAAHRARDVAEQATTRLREQHDVLTDQHGQTERRLATIEAELAAARHELETFNTAAEKRITDLHTMYEARLIELHQQFDRAQQQPASPSTKQPTRSRASRTHDTP